VARKIKLEINIDGKPVTPISHFVLNQHLFSHHYFEVNCPVKEADQTLINECNKYIGKELKVDVKSEWFGDSSGSIFKGVVTNVSLSRYQDSVSNLILSGYGGTIFTDDGPWAVSYTEKDLKGIANEILGKYSSLDSMVGPIHTSPIPYIVQYKESNFQFLSRIADLYGEWFYYDGLKVVFGKLDKQNAIELKLGRDLHQFDLSLRAMPTEFDLQAYDYVNSQLHSSPSSAATLNDLDQYGNAAFQGAKQIFHQAPVIPFPETVASKSDLDSFATAKHTSHAHQLVIISGTSDNPHLSVGATIKIKGTLSQNGSTTAKEVEYGEFTIIQVNHQTDGLGNYQNQFEAIPAGLKNPPRNPKVQQPPAETQVATVKDNKDPENLGRVQVQFNWQPGSETTPWIRVPSAAGGSGQGFFFVPEVGDEVLVSFENNNPSKPYVEGCVYNSNSKPGAAGDSSNNKKQILTKSGNQINFNDEAGKEEISIVNGGNVVTLTLDGPKITIVTEGDLELTGKNISISASENLTLSAGKNLEGSGGQNTTLSGGTKLEASAPMVDVKGDQKTSIASSMMLELNGGQMATVTATMLKLN
jgi:type VI secretion system secreted protein VgrG